MKHKIKSFLTGTRAKFMTALPILIFFMFLFYSIVLIFGISHVIMVSAITSMFKINFRRALSIKQLLLFIGTQFLLAFLGFFATLNLPLCLLLNLTVPFLLVFLQSSQFNQLGYFASAMFFVFLQLKAVAFNGLPMQMSAVAYGLGVLAAALLLCSFHNRKADSFVLAKKGLLTLAEALREGCSPAAAEKENSAQKMFPILRELYKEAHKSRGLKNLVNPEGRIQYMFALLFQRSAYFLTSPYQLPKLADVRCRQVLLHLARYMEFAGTDGFGPETLSSLNKHGKELLDELKGREEAPCVFSRNFLNLFLLILENVELLEQGMAPPCWKVPSYHHPVKKLLCRLKTDTFETRFALRLSIVLTIGFTYNVLAQANHGYWLALNSFFLLRPMYEDSTFRIKSRFIGTIAGCFLLQLLLPLFRGTPGHLLLATIMAAGLYMEVPGTWKQALFSTCFALTLTTMALPQHLAMGLRLLYVAFAILLVLVINRFFFPTSLKSQFQYNLNQLFHMHHVYLRLLFDSITAPLDYSLICDTQIHYHLIHDQILEYLKEPNRKDADFIKELLRISWHMISEAEQMMFLINNRKTNTLDTRQMEEYLMFTACILSEIQNKMNIHAEQDTTLTDAISAEAMNYKRSMEGESYLSELMNQYSKQVSAMYRCVCRHRALSLTAAQTKQP